MTVLLHLTEAAGGFFLPTLCNNCTLTSSYYYRFTNKSNLMLWLISTGNDQLKHYAYHLRLGNAICSTCLLYGCQQRVTYITPTFLPFHWKRRLLTWHKWPWLTKAWEWSGGEHTTLALPPSFTFFSSLTPPIIERRVSSLHSDYFWSMMRNE